MEKAEKIEVPHQVDSGCANLYELAKFVGKLAAEHNALVEKYNALTQKPVEDAAPQS